MALKTLRFVTTVAIVLALLVVMLGAYTRLTNAGLGCPDWPGCYGHMVLPTLKAKLIQAQSNYPWLPIESQKAWTEMVHRYAAGTLAVLILVILGGALRTRRQGVLLTIPVLLVALVVFQALLGMWTVTLKLLPVVVMSHLLGGVLIFASLVYFRWQLSGLAGSRLGSSPYWAGLGVIMVLLQIALGGWVSSNYAGIACAGFPKCNGTWWPDLHLSEGFNLFLPVGANYQGGLLDNNVRVTIQFIHRIGAIITAAYILILSLVLFVRYDDRCIRRFSTVAIFIVLLQFSLGVLNVIYLLPLWVAVAHNCGAALLLAATVSLFYIARGDTLDARRA